MTIEPKPHGISPPEPQGKSSTTSKISGKVSHLISTTSANIDSGKGDLVITELKNMLFAIIKTPITLCKTIVMTILLSDISTKKHMIKTIYILAGISCIPFAIQYAVFSDVEALFILLMFIISSILLSFLLLCNKLSIEHIKVMARSSAEATLHAKPTRSHKKTGTSSIIKTPPEIADSKPSQTDNTDDIIIE